MRIFLLTLLCSTLCAGDDESLALRRIADFWEEGEFQVAKTEIEGFLSQFPESTHFDLLCSALGDLHLRENSYQTAVNYYAQIKEPSAREQVFIRRMQCLYHLGWYATLADECEAFLQKHETSEHKLQATYLLAIGLYQQCVHAETSAQQTLALRAKPYFETLSNSELSEEAAGAYAQLSCILGDFKTASDIYLKLAATAENPDEMRFQAALLQAKFDKSLSATTFAQLADGQSPQAKDSAYNQLVLAFEQGNLEGIVAEKDKWLERVSPERKSFVHLIVGKSLLSLKKFPEGAVELNAFLASNPAQETVRPAALHLLEAAYQAGNLSLLEQTMNRLEGTDLGKARLMRAELLTKAGKLVEAGKELEAISGENTLRADALLAQISMAAAQEQWAICRARAEAFVRGFPEHPQLAHAKRALIAASVALGNREQLAADLEFVLATNTVDKDEFRFLLGKTKYEAGVFEKALECLHGIDTADAALLRALCYRDGFQDTEAFCTHAEAALAQGATLLTSNEQHMALFNGHLTLKQLEKASQHLLAAFEAKAEIHPENLAWLGDFLYGQFEKKQVSAETVYRFLSESQLPSEIRLARLEKHLGKPAEAMARLEKLEEPEALLLLGELVMQQGNLSRAEELFSRAAGKSLRADKFSAAAALQTARLKVARQQAAEAAVLLKNLVLQKTLANEPSHLEAGLDYVELHPDKRKVFLEKLKADYVSQNDVLSADYHAAKKQFPEQEKIYTQYMKYIDAELLLCEQKELQAKELLLQLQNEPLPAPLGVRVERRLK